MTTNRIHLDTLMAALSDLEQAILENPEDALEASRNVSAAADIPVGWIARVELGFEVMNRDGEITSEEALSVIDAASKFTFLNTEELDPFFLDNTSFMELMETEAVLLANESILAENQRILDANEAIIESGADTPLLEVKDIVPFS